MQDFILFQSKFKHHAFDRIIIFVFLKETQNFPNLYQTTEVADFTEDL